MDHMKKYWSEELELIRKGINGLDGYRTIISNHYYRDRQSDRGYDEMDVLMAITTGRIVEGYDCGQHPTQRNRDPKRIIIGKDKYGEWVVVPVAMKSSKEFIVTTVFPPTDLKRYGKYLVD
ncbi:hypothetical protein Theco_3999 (plasmid) [Thermobacillus composti KWC4]|jgi:hypothetical protein|uniref:DUF4258 domain-containing protein n=1 Tax=Thermobacillus composti (strain DSM 18247 / JCM 13945 / KWC4) TaxID=717605 RepID=L0EIB4_THECK|nr:DUF4258 domain-containing protein [Thermobacillus composti]AGA60003.1 hypothetical protein Theco_3999 [Thermobacillus composti KWC4]